MISDVKLSWVTVLFSFILLQYLLDTFCALVSVSFLTGFLQLGWLVLGRSSISISTSMTHLNWINKRKHKISILRRYLIHAQSIFQKCGKKYTSVSHQINILILFYEQAGHKRGTQMVKVLDGIVSRKIILYYDWASIKHRDKSKRLYCSKNRSKRNRDGSGFLMWP